MPNEGPPKRENQVDSSKPAEKRFQNTVESGMNVDQGHHYDVRAGVYDKQNATPGRDRRIMDRFYWMRLRRFLPPGSLTYLDFGCATGTHTRQFLAGLDEHPVAEGYAVDISPKMTELATQALPDFRIIQGGAEKIDFENKFDLMTSFFHVLGHLTPEELELFFNNAARSLKPGGLLCFDVLRDLGRFRKMVFHKTIFPPKETYFKYNPKLPDGSPILDDNGQPLVGSIRRFSKQEIIDLASRHSLQMVDIEVPKKSTGELVAILRKK